MKTTGLHAVPLLCSFLAACGLEAAPGMPIGARCHEGDLEVQAELRHPIRCEELLRITVKYRDEYEARFGRQDLAGRAVRYRNADPLDAEGHTGRTYADVIDLARFAWASLPHELNHVRLGSGHAGWCADFEPWSEAVLGIDEREYLGCR